MSDGIVSVQQHMTPTKVVHNLQLKLNAVIYDSTEGSKLIISTELTTQLLYKYKIKIIKHQLLCHEEKNSTRKGY